MTRTFYCPGCGGICGFAERHAGRTARCTRCNQRFIIPDVNNVKAQKVKEERGNPLPGFYRQVLIKTWPVFFHKDSLVSLAFLASLIVFRFFLTNVDLSAALPGFVLLAPIGWIIVFLTWGCQIWYCMETISTTMDQWDDFLSPDIGAGFEFIWNMIKTWYLFVVAVILVEVPFLLLAGWLQNARIGWPWLWQTITLAGFILLPMALLILASGPQMYSILRPDYFGIPIVRAFRPYLLVAAIFLLAAWFELITKQYHAVQDQSRLVIAMHLAGNLLAANLWLVAMRAIGLFGRHFHSVLPW